MKLICRFFRLILKFIKIHKKSTRIARNSTHAVTNRYVTIRITTEIEEENDVRTFYVISKDNIDKKKNFHGWNVEVLLR